MDNPHMLALPRPGHQLLACLLLTAACTACMAAYWPGLAGTFLFDDYPNLSALRHDGGVHDARDVARYVFTNDSGVLGRPVSMLSFLINDNGWPSDAASFKYTNVLIHVLCGVLVFALARALAQLCGGGTTRAPYVGALCAGLWLLHPLHVSTVLYVVQRMTQLASLFTLAGLLCYLAGRRWIVRNPFVGGALVVASMVPFGLLATLSKESGILICAFVLVIEATLNRGVPRNRLHKAFLVSFAAAPLVLLLGYIAWTWPATLRTYELRDFSLAERLLTEPRILADYLRLILAYRPWGTGLLHDDFPVSTGLTNPISTVICLALFGAALAGALIGRRRFPVLAFAVLWFLAGHALESTVLPLELYFEHRNYLPMFGPLFAVAWHGVAAASAASDKWVGGSLAAVLVAVLGLMVASLGSTARTWGDPNVLFPVWEVENPTSGRAKRVAATYFNAANDPGTSLLLLREVAELAPDNYGARIQALDIACTHGLPLPWTVSDLTTNPSRWAISDGTSTSLDRLSEHVLNGDCESISLDQLSAQFTAIEQAGNAATNPGRLSRILFLHADVYKAQGDLDGTMRSLEHTWDLLPTTSIALSIVSVLHSAGLNEPAAVWMDRARQADARRPMLAPSRLEEINAYARRIGLPAP